MEDLDKILVIGGATCSGKTELSIELAEIFPLEIVNFDSMCFYRYFDIGTAKPVERERSIVPQHLFDIKYPDEDYNAAAFRIDASSKINEIKNNRKIPIFSGGTGLYMKSLIYGLSPIPEFDKSIYRQRALKLIKEQGSPAVYKEIKRIDPIFAEKISPNDSQRIARAYEVFEATGKPISFYLSKNPFNKPIYNYLYFVLIPSKEYLKSCIMERTKKMLEAGLVDEIKDILNMGYSKDLKPFKAIGYKEGLSYLEGEIKSERELFQQIVDSSLKYAKRQATYFKKTENAVIMEDYDLKRKLGIMKSMIEKFIYPSIPVKDAGKGSII